MCFSPVEEGGRVGGRVAVLVGDGEGGAALNQQRAHLAVVPLDG